MVRLMSRWSVLIAANVVICSVLSFYQTGNAAPKPTGQPFANSVMQRKEMVEQLKEIKTLLREQNSLLRSGKVRVVMTK